MTLFLQTSLKLWHFYLKTFHLCEKPCPNRAQFFSLLLVPQGFAACCSCACCQLRRHGLTANEASGPEVPGIGLKDKRRVPCVRKRRLESQGWVPRGRTACSSCACCQSQEHNRTANRASGLEVLHIDEKSAPTRTLVREARSERLDGAHRDRAACRGCACRRHAQLLSV